TTLHDALPIWEMLNKSVMSSKPLAVLGGFWAPVLDRVREVELGQHAPWGEANGRRVYVADSPGEAAQHLQHHLREKKWHAPRKKCSSLTSCGSCSGCARPVRRDGELWCCLSRK